MKRRRTIIPTLTTTLQARCMAEAEAAMERARVKAAWHRMTTEPVVSAKDVALVHAARRQGFQFEAQAPSDPADD